MRGSITERNKYPINGRPDKVGHFLFNGVQVDFFDFYTKSGVHYLINESYLPVIEDMNGIIDNLHTFTYFSKSEIHDITCRVREIFLTTSFNGKIEVVFDVNLPKDKVRSAKLDILINE